MTITPDHRSVVPGDLDQPRQPDEWEEVELVVAALDLLAHWWSRPDPAEFLVWESAGELASRLYRHYSPTREAPIALSQTVADLRELADEYERLFVGPGAVPCPPYESFWRDDIPVETRRGFTGPCTADLRHLYRELGLQVSQRSEELPDHIAVELEALAYAVSIDGSGPLAQRLFFNHLKRWLPRLCRAVSCETEHGMYRELAEVSLEWLVPIERHLASLLDEASEAPE